jgi:hypothetical protein
MKPDKVTSIQIPCLKVNMPELFADSDFMDWLNSGKSRVATWHEIGACPDDYSDVFMTYDHGEGSDAEEMPRHCWEAIVGAVSAAGLENGYLVVWITNLPRDDSED